MKKLSLLIVAVALTLGTAFGQANEIEMFQSMYKIEKKAMLMDFLQLSEENAKVFWPIYEEYEAERVKLGARRIELIQKYSEEYETLTDEQADALMSESFTIRMKEEKLQQKYYKKVKKEMTALLAVQFIQFERFVRTSVDNKLNSQLPLVGERQ